MIIKTGTILRYKGPIQLPKGTIFRVTNTSFPISCNIEIEQLPGHRTYCVGYLTLHDRFDILDRELSDFEKAIFEI